MPLGGAQAMLADLAVGLARRGHRVTLLGADGSCLEGVETPRLGVDHRALSPIAFAAPSDRPDGLQQAAAFERAAAWIRDKVQGEFVVHSHAFDAPAFFALEPFGAPVAHTLHLGPIDRAVSEAARCTRSRLVVVSHSSARQWRDAGAEIGAVIPNGVPVSAIGEPEFRGRHVVIAGRVSPEKGVHDAIDAARLARLPLVIIGGIYDRAYFEQQIAPRVRIDVCWDGESPAGAKAVYVGSLARDELARALGRAYAAIVPVNADETFSLAAVEAQAAGCPVVAVRRGPMPEVVRDGETGILVDDDEPGTLADGLRRVAAIDPARCREWATSQFSIDAMLDRHEALYAALLEEVICT